MEDRCFVLLRAFFDFDVNTLLFRVQKQSKIEMKHTNK